MTVCSGIDMHGAHRQCELLSVYATAYIRKRRYCRGVPLSDRYGIHMHGAQCPVCTIFSVHYGIHTHRTHCLASPFLEKANFLGGRVVRSVSKKYTHIMACIRTYQ